MSDKPESGIQPVQLNPSLRRRIASALQIKDDLVDTLPFIPVVMVANLDNTPGPRFEETQEGAPYEVLEFSLVAARASSVPERIFPNDVPIGQVWVDALTAGAVAQLQVGNGRGLLTLSAVGQSYDFLDMPTTKGLFLANAATPGATIKLGVALGRNLRARV